MDPEISWSNFSIATLIIMLTISYWLLLDFAGCFMIACVEFVFLPCYALKYYLRYIKVVIMYTIASEVGNSSGFGLPKKRLQVYRELQILSTLYNVIQKDTVMCTFISSIICCIVVCLYCLITLGSGISLPQFIMFSVILADTVMGIIVMFGTFSKVNQKSLNVLEIIKEKVVTMFLKKQERNWLNKFVRSLPPLKVLIGDDNFVDKATPLVLLDFCLGMLVNLLLL